MGNWVSWNSNIKSNIKKGNNQLSFNLCSKWSETNSPLAISHESPKFNKFLTVFEVYSLTTAGLSKCLKVNSVSSTHLTYTIKPTTIPQSSILLTFLTKNKSWRRIVMLRLLPLLRLAISLPVEPADKTSVSWRYGQFFLLCHQNILRKVIYGRSFCGPLDASD